MQKVLYVGPSDSDRPDIASRGLQTLLDEGYTVVSVTSQHCSIAVGSGYTQKAFGGFLVILENPDIKLE